MKDMPIRKRVGVGAIVLVTWGLVAGLQADEITLFTPNQPPGVTRTISFPSGQCTGNLYLEPESGTDWDPKCVRPSGKCEYLRPGVMYLCPNIETSNCLFDWHLARWSRQNCVHRILRPTSGVPTGPVKTRMICQGCRNLTRMTCIGSQSAPRCT
ncbi:hypothetical protein ES703_44969 [subsurface metagenome]